jgi:hypothetical protein
MEGDENERTDEEEATTTIDAIQWELILVILKMVGAEYITAICRVCRQWRGFKDQLKDEKREGRGSYTFGALKEKTLSLSFFKWALDNKCPGVKFAYASLISFPYDETAFQCIKYLHVTRKIIITGNVLYAACLSKNVRLFKWAVQIGTKIDDEAIRAAARWGNPDIGRFICCATFRRDFTDW